MQFVCAFVSWWLMILDNWLIDIPIFSLYISTITSCNSPDAKESIIPLGIASGRGDARTTDHNFSVLNNLVSASRPHLCPLSILHGSLGDSVSTHSHIFQIVSHLCLPLHSHPTTYCLLSIWFLTDSIDLDVFVASKTTLSSHVLTSCRDVVSTSTLQLTCCRSSHKSLPLY